MIMIMIITCISYCMAPNFCSRQLYYIKFLFCRLIFSVLARCHQINAVGLFKCFKSQPGFCSPMIVPAFTILAACDKGIDIMCFLHISTLSDHSAYRRISLEYSPGAEILTWTLISRYLFIYHLNVSWTPQISYTSISHCDSCKDLGLILYANRWWDKHYCKVLGLIYIIHWAFLSSHSIFTMVSCVFHWSDYSIVLKYEYGVHT